MNRKWKHIRMVVDQMRRIQLLSIFLHAFQHQEIQIQNTVYILIEQSHAFLIRGGIEKYQKLILTEFSNSPFRNFKKFK